MARSPYEIKCQKELQVEGWQTDYKIRPRICPRGYKVDFFGAFDIIARHPEFNYIRWISIKGKAGIPRAHRKLIEAFILPPNNVKEIWHRTLNRKWVKEIIE